MIEIDKLQPEPSPFLAQDDSPAAVEINAIPMQGLSIEATNLSLLQPTDEDALKDYQNTMGRPPQEIPSLMSAKMRNQREKFNGIYANALMPMFSDPAVPLSQKEAAMKTARSQELAPEDPTQALVNENLASASPGESVQGEAVRAKMIERLNVVNDHIRQQQEIENGVRGAKEGPARQLFEMLERFLPGESGITAGRIAQKLYHDPSITSAAALLPGTARRQLNDAIRQMPIEQRTAFLQELAPIVGSSSGLLTDKNQLRINEWITEAARGRVSSTDEWMDNIGNILDIVGVGSMIKALPNAAKVTKNAFDARKLEQMRAVSDANRVEPPMNTPVTPASKPVPENLGDSRVSTPTQNTRLSELEARHSELLGETGGKLDNGEVANLRREMSALQDSLKQGMTGNDLRKKGAATAAVERRQNIQSQIDRIETQLQNNAKANKAEQELASLEKQMEALRKNPVEEPAVLNPIASIYRRAELNSVLAYSNPRSAASVVSLTNPAKAKALHAQIYFQDDSFAKAVSGNTKNEALLQAVAPKIDDGSGVVKAAVNDKESWTREALISQFQMAVKNVASGFAFTEAEIARARAAKVNDYSTVAGMKINDAMSSMHMDGTQMNWKGTYTNGESGWLRAEDAVSQAMVAFRKQGIDEKNIEVLARNVDEYVPVKLEDVRGVEGDYAIRVNISEDLRAYEVSGFEKGKDGVPMWDALDVKRNVFDYLQTKGGDTWGSIQRHFMDAASTLHKQITGTASVLDDKASRLGAAFQEMIKTKFADELVKLPKARQKAVKDYLMEANIKELAFDPVALANRFNKQELDVISGFRDAMDVFHHFENYDLVKSLQKDGFLLFQHPNLEAVVRERPKRYDVRKAYDPAQDKIVALKDTDIDNIYTAKGNIAEFRRPVDIAGETVEHIIVRNTNGQIARKVRDTDTLLAKRDGYFPVFYKAPRFIDETYTDGGKTYTRTIAVSDNIREAEDAVKNLQAQNPDKSYRHRGDDRKINRSADTYWDMQHVGGRLAQRHRSQLLENSVGIKQIGAVSQIENPVDAAMRAAHSLGGRLAMRDGLDVMKQRFMSQFRDLLKEENGIVQFPAKRDDIAAKGEISSKRLADARTTWEYIRSMENGYVNAMDSTVKNALNAMADAAGLKGYDTTEKILRAGSDVALTGAVKGGVFLSMIVSNPLRQYLIQANGSLRMSAYNPSGFFTGRVFGMLTEVLENRILGKNISKEAGEFYDWLLETGIEQGIARGNEIRGTVVEAADRANGFTRVMDATVGNMRKYGYEKAEGTNMAIHAGFVWDRYKQAGKDLTDHRVRDEAHAELRALTYNMNMAGEMPYNRNIGALIMTYQQVAHKALLSPFNRQLDVNTRLRLLAADLTFWGLPVGLITEMAGTDLPIENQWMRQFLEDGLQSVVLNLAATAITGERQNVDYSSFNPMDPSGMNKLLQQALVDGGLKGLISQAPAARVFGLDPDSRLGLALRTTAAYFTDFRNEGVEIDGLTARDVANAWGQMSSGWTNFQKARAAWMLGVARDKRGGATDDDVTHWEAINMALGFNTRDTAAFYNTFRKSGSAAPAKDAKDQARSDVRMLATVIGQATANDPTQERAIRMITQAFASTGWMPDKEYERRYLSALYQEIQKPAMAKITEKLFRDIINVPDVSNKRDVIKNAGLTPDLEEQFLSVYDEKMKQFQAFKVQAEQELKNKKENK